MRLQRQREAQQQQQQQWWGTGQKMCLRLQCLASLPARCLVISKRGCTHCIDVRRNEAC
jgi:hypothetical protein